MPKPQVSKANQEASHEHPPLPLPVSPVPGPGAALTRASRLRVSVKNRHDRGHAISSPAHSFSRPCKPNAILMSSPRSNGSITSMAPYRERRVSPSPSLSITVQFTPARPLSTTQTGRESMLTPGRLEKYAPGLNGEGAEAGRSLPHDLTRGNGLTDQTRS